MRQLIAAVLFLALTQTAEAAMNVHQFSADTIDGETVSLDRYAGQALLIVNTASRCGFTPQYASLQKLYEKFEGRGLRILAFPSNDFGAQEPGTNAEIKEFCDLRFKITFDLFSKIPVKGENAHPLYRYLTTESGFNGPIQWNFNKFLVSPDGEVTARFPSKTDPLSPELTAELEKILPS